MNDLLVNDALEIFPWNDNFSVGIPEIDVQHQRLVQLLNKLGSDLVFNSEHIDLNTLFNELAEYAVFHFQTEENVWHKFLAGDRWETAHKGTHESFVAELTKLKSEDTVKPQHEVMEGILIFLTHWLAYHILESDKRTAMIVLSVQSGMSIEDAKRKSHLEMTGSTRVLIQTVLTMYDTVALRTLQMMKASQKATSVMKRNQMLMESTPEGIHILDEHGKVIEANEAFCRHLGYKMEEMLQLSVYDFEAKLSSEELQVSLKNSLNGHAQIETLHRRKDGTLVDVEVIISGVELDGDKTIFALSRDITERKQLAERVHQLAYFDALTNLPNRRMLNDRLSHALALSKRTGHCGALLFIDLDNFKPLNDNHGHGVGDLLLIEVAERLIGTIREMDTVARFGGDEFVVILGELENDKTAAAIHASTVAEKILETLNKPYEITIPDGVGVKQITHSCSASIGVVTYVNHEGDIDELLKQADMAMYQAKEAGRNSVRFFKP
jgi:diguanylate cyclase (GGDEF)-like protein/hemerythrin-like metal-binding protein/PAS domain S-box-containing protein